MPSFKIAPYHLRSLSSKLLAQELNCVRLLPERSQYRHRRHDIVINWGCSGPRPFPVDVNQPQAVARAVHKLHAYHTFREHSVPTVDATQDRGVAQGWLSSGYSVYCRATETGFGGCGITLVRPANPTLPDALFYTRRFNAKREFRIHVAFGQVIELAEKKRRNGTTPNIFIRSHGDWVFCKHGLAPIPDQLRTAAISAVRALGLDFAGIDGAIGPDGQCCIFEANTAPGIEGTTVIKYAAAFRSLRANRSVNASN